LEIFERSVLLVDVFSPTRLETFAECPAAGFRRYILGLPELATEAQNFGKAAHAVIAEALRVGNDEPEFMESLCRAAAAACGCDADELFRAVRRRDVLKWFGFPNLRLEEHFRVSLDPGDPEGPELQGYVDLWAPAEDGDVLLVDWKSGWREYRPTDRFQLGLYAWYLWCLTGSPVRAFQIFLRTGTVYHHRYTPENGIEAARAWALETARDVRERLARVRSGADPREEFPARPGERCLHCGWAPSCADGAAVPGAVETPGEAEAVAREILRLEGALKSVLRRWVEAVGPVAVDGQEFRLVPAVTWKWSPEALGRAVVRMRQQSVDPFAVLSLSSSGLKKLGWTEDECLALGAEKSESVQFRHVSVGGRKR
jgi:hypothetical protein